MPNKIENIIKFIKKSGKYGEKPVFSLEEIKKFEEKLGFKFPNDYKILVTSLEPEIVNFYFVQPYRHSVKKHYVVFAEWTDDVFAFNEKDHSVITILKDDDSGMKWNNFTEWMEYVWDMSSKPVNPE
ncbi:MAG: hypothetical protein KatS3mg129_1406 [Leptospiraceae bacterium]|nr:MAG: hypothetical protein KatS3mg129_1406 [Leptospiraceae bacterium]